MTAKRDDILFFFAFSLFLWYFLGACVHVLMLCSRCCCRWPLVFTCLLPLLPGAEREELSTRRADADTDFDRIVVHKHVCCAGGQCRDSRRCAHVWQGDENLLFILTPLMLGPHWPWVDDLLLNLTAVFHDDCLSCSTSPRPTDTPAHLPVLVLFCPQVCP